MNADTSSEMLDCVWAIEAIAQLMQKAFETSPEGNNGVFGSAVVLEVKAKRLLELMGQA
jgi:hypothetical protein